MGKLNEIREKLSAGSTAKQLVEQGYARSSVFSMAKKLKGSQPNIPAMPISDELQELRRQRDMLKLQKEIAELEASKERLPERVTGLEAKLHELEGSAFTDRVEDALNALFENTTCLGCGQKGWTLLRGLCAYCGKELTLTIGLTEDHRPEVERGWPVRKH